MEQCVALTDYDACEAGEISFRRGDVITVTAKGSTSGYWEGCVVAPGHAEGSCGLFPNCFVSSNMRPQQKPTFCNKALCLYDYKAADASEMSFRKGDLLGVVRPSASPGWWCGVNESEAGRMRQRQESEDAVALACGTVTEPLLLPSNFVTCRIVVAAFSFEARQKHELVCEVGDVIQVHRKWNDGWWEGTLRGRRGIFPSNYTLPNVATTTPPFFCNVCKTVFADGPLRCEACHKDEEVTRSMIAALDDYAAGKIPTLDLFAYVEIEKTGTGERGIGAAAAAEGSVRRATGMPV
ncbi:putative intersectin-1-like [Trypanosoma grayi]|uniref:putative intersectin-1-like n=1 Tax=Trypanosoma grayi TaxID=71804 RepID=UPI0004F47957|nr:putative intersectin-1-like [Trypanosoma grayi]KEG11985.1 putative intersectin-1-like [Trypanosoma grayi]